VYETREQKTRRLKCVILMAETICFTNVAGKQTIPGGIRCS